MWNIFLKNYVEIYILCDGYNGVKPVLSVYALVVFKFFFCVLNAKEIKYLLL